MPHWLRLAADYEDTETQLVARVDCLTGNERLCDEFGIAGTPVIAFLDPSEARVYDGPGDYDSLKQFAEDHLTPLCSVTNIDLCDDEQKELIGGFMNMTLDDLNAAKQLEDEKLNEIQTNFTNWLSYFDDVWTNANNVRNWESEDIKSGELKLIKAVMAEKEKI